MRATSSSYRAALSYPERRAAAPSQSVWLPVPTSEDSQRSPRPSAPSIAERDSQRVKEAAEFCADSLSDGWQTAVVGRVTDYAESSWERLARSHQKRNCKSLARIARSILETKAALHKAAGQLFGWVTAAFRADGAAHAFAEELASKVPLGPVDAKMIGVARGVQVTGILLCVMNDRDLTTCECFIDMALAETKERVNQILTSAISNWSNLAHCGPSAVA